MRTKMSPTFFSKYSKYMKNTDSKKRKYLIRILNLVNLHIDYQFVSSNLLRGSLLLSSDKCQSWIKNTQNRSCFCHFRLNTKKIKAFGASSICAFFFYLFNFLSTVWLEKKCFYENNRPEFLFSSLQNYLVYSVPNFE